MADTADATEEIIINLEMSIQSARRNLPPDVADLMIADALAQIERLKSQASANEHRLIGHKRGFL